MYWQADANADVPAVSAFGEAQAWTLGNGIHVRRDHDPATGAVAAIMAGPGENGAARVSLSYGYGPRGNTTRVMHIDTGVSRDLGYDSLNRQSEALLYNTVNGYTPLTTGYNAEGSLASRTGGWQLRLPRCPAARGK